MDVFLNGEWTPEEQATVSAFDRGFLYGDGVFETVRIYQGHPFLLERHLGRLAHGLSGLHIEDPFSFDEWTAHCRELIARNKVSDGILRIHITRGTGKRGYSSMGCSAPTVLISLHDAPPVADPKTRVNIITATGILSDHDPLSTFKTANKLVNIIAMREAEQTEVHDALLLNRNGHATETAASNIFAVLDNDLATPSLASGCLGGITRGYILELAADLGIRTVQCDLPHDELLLADGLFLTNSVREIQPIGTLDGHDINQSPLTLKLQQTYRERVQAAL